MGKLDRTWSKGIFLGVKGLSDEKIIGTPEGVFRTRTTQRVPLEERWSAEAAGLVGGVPWLTNRQDEKADADPLNVEPLKPMSEELLRDTEMKAPPPRNANLKKGDFAKHGYTPDCPGCTSILLGRHYHQGHSEACRKRVEECLKDDARIKAARQRMTEYAAERIRGDDEKRRRTEGEVKEGEGVTVDEPKYGGVVQF